MGSVSQESTCGEADFLLLGVGKGCKSPANRYNANFRAPSGVVVDVWKNGRKTLQKVMQE